MTAHNKLDVQPGHIFGRLTIVSEIGGYPRRFICKCACGKIIERALGDLRNRGALSGRDTACGCYRRELTIARNTTHGLTGTPEWLVWAGMRKRCLNPKCKRYSDYGGRGIAICERWGSFPAFLEDMGSRPTPQHTIERNDTNGNYCKDNCRWATRKEQNRNTRASTFIEIGGVKKCLAEWDEHFTALGVLKARRFKYWYYWRGLDVALQKAGVR